MLSKRTMSLEQIIGKKSHELTAEALQEKLQGFRRVVVDLGCGDGMLPYRLAKENPDIFYIGVDAARESLAVASAKAAKKPSRGGCPNVIFLCANVLERMPPLEGIADEVQWNFPWGSLMYALVGSDPIPMHNMKSIGKPESDFKFYLNLYVFENETQRQDMGLPEVDEDYVKKTLIPAWNDLGIETTETKFVSADDLKDHPSTWAGRLVRRSGRNSLLMTGVIHDEW